MNAHRCPTCGAVPPLWSKPRIIEAMRAWAGRHGKPPTSYQWAMATRAHPHAGTVTQMFGTWGAGLEAAGLIEVDRRKLPEWDRDGVIRALRAWTSEHGSPPRAKDWCRAGDGHPSDAVVRFRFGSWNAGLIAAGLPLRRERQPRIHRPLAAA